MEKIDEISKDNIEKKYIVGVMVIISLMWIVCFISGYLDINKLDLKILYLPVLVIGTLVVHEYIHVVLFKVFSKGRANIEVKRDRKLGAIVVYQKNQEVFYNKKQTVVILLMPLVLITTISLIKITILPYWAMVLKVNMLLNILGSSTDLVTSYKLFKYKGEVKVNYDFIKGKGIQMNIYR